MATRRKNTMVKKATKKVTRRTPVTTARADEATAPAAVAGSGTGIFQVHAPRAVRDPSNELLGLPALSQKQRLQEAKAVAEQINKQHGSRVVITANEATSNAYLRRPCGLMQLDLDTGGGMPAAGFSTISGPDNSGKSTLLYMYFAMHQRLYGEQAYNLLASTESKIDYWMARRVGWVIPLPQALIESEQRERSARNVPLLTREEVAELRREVGVNTFIELDVAEDVMDALEMNLASNVYGIAGLDSLDALMPDAEAEIDSYHDNPQQAARAGILTRFFQHYGPISRHPAHFTSFIVTCQVRSNRKKAEAASFMQKYIKDWTDTVPYSVRHWRQINLTMWSGGKMSGKKNEDEGKKQVPGKMVNWEVRKGKSGTHDNITGEAEYYYDSRCFDIERSAVMTGLRYGVINEHEGLLTFYGDNGQPHHALKDIAGVDRFLEVMRSNFEYELALRREILAAAGKSCAYC